MDCSTLTLLRGERTAARGILSWGVVEGCEALPVLDVAGIQRNENGILSHYIVLRIHRVKQDPKGLRVRFDDQLYYVREVRSGVRISEMELLCETLGDYVRSELDRLREMMSKGSNSRPDPFSRFPTRENELMAAVAAALSVNGIPIV